MCDGREGEPTEQLIIVGGDGIASQRPEVALAYEPAVNSVYPADPRNFVLEQGRSARGEKVRRIGDMGVAIPSAA